LKILYRKCLKKLEKLNNKSLTEEPRALNDAISVVWCPFLIIFKEVKR